MVLNEVRSGAVPARFVIGCRARTGSTMLRWMLNSHPDICCHGEVFSEASLDGRFVNVRDTQVTAADPMLSQIKACRPDVFLRQFVFDAGKFKAIGVKTLYHDLEQYAGGYALDAIRNDHDIRIIHLTRANRLKRYVSNYIASYVTKVAVVFDERDRPAVQRIVLSPEECVRDIAATEKAEERFRGYFTEHKVFEVAYEQLLEREGSAIPELQRFLGIHPKALKARTVKLNPDSLRDLIENYAEVSDALHAAGYGHYLAA